MALQVTADITRPALRYHGGKFRVAPWVLGLMPPHGSYIEPYGGGGSILLRKPRVRNEVYNDLDQRVVNFFRVLRDPASAAEDADHRELAEVLHGCRGMVMLSGYRSALYDELYGDWRRHEHKAAADMGKQRTECMWLNAAAQAGAIQMGLL